MLKSNYNNIKIGAVSAAVSNEYKSIETCISESAYIEDFNLSKFKKQTGVLGKYICKPKQTCADLCVAAAKKILDEDLSLRDQIGIVVYVTQSPDYRSPATACVIQHRLSLKEDCFAIDLNMGCSGFLAGLNVTAGLLLGSNCQKALLLCGDICSQNIKRDTNIDESYLLFGDAGTATLLEKSNDIKTNLMVYSATRGNSVNIISAPGGAWKHFEWKLGNLMDGVEVFNFAVNDAVEMLAEYMKDNHTSPDDYDKLVLHQANLYIMKQIAKRLHFSIEKLSVSLDQFGNTSCASIPLSIVNDYGNAKTSEQKKLLICGFGVGLSWATSSFSINVEKVYPLLHTDEVYDDGVEESDY